LGSVILLLPHASERLRLSIVDFYGLSLRRPPTILDAPQTTSSSRHSILLIIGLLLPQLLLLGLAHPIHRVLIAADPGTRIGLPPCKVRGGLTAELGLEGALLELFLLLDRFKVLVVSLELEFLVQVLLVELVEFLLDLSLPSRGEL